MNTFLQKNALNLFAMAFSTFALVTTIAVNGPQGPVGSSGAVGPVGSSGPIGSTGASGLPGEDGATPYIGPNGNWWIDGVDSGISASGTIVNGMNLPNYRVVPTQEELGYLYEEPPFFDLNNQAAYVSEKLAEGYIGIDSSTAFFNLIGETGNYVLTNDLDFSTLDSWAPIMVGDDGSFKGTLDGAGYTIENLQSTNLTLPNNSLNGVGLFFWLDGATVLNLAFSDGALDLKAASINDLQFTSVGLLAGMVDRSDIQNVIIINSFVSGLYSAGLLSGSVYDSRINNVFLFNGEVAGDSQIGGLIGQAYDSVMLNIDAIITLNMGQYSIGGLVGSSDYNFYAYVDVVVNLDNQLSQQSTYDIGGVTGSSEEDRFFYIETRGEMIFNANLHEQSFAQIGGVTGYANNSTYYMVENHLNLEFYLTALLTTEIAYITSIGGILGDVLFGLIDHAINFGSIIIATASTDLNYELYAPNPDSFAIEYLGGIVGYVRGSAFISYVINFGDLEGFAEVGGIIGSTGIPFFLLQQNVIVQSAANFGAVHGFLLVGGIIGLMDERTNFTVANVINHGAITGGFGVGGLVGFLIPIVGIKIHLINSANFGDVTVREEGGGGLIGGASPFLTGIFFEFPVFGEINLYNTFNAGSIIFSTSIDNAGDYETFGSIIGIRELMITMYGVSYLKQTFEVEMTNYDPITDTFEPTGEFFEVIMQPVGIGNLVDLTFVENAALLTVAETFIYRTVWNFNTTWAWVDGLLLPQMPDFVD